MKEKIDEVKSIKSLTSPTFKAPNFKLLKLVFTHLCCVKISFHVDVKLEIGPSIRPKAPGIDEVLNLELKNSSFVIGHGSPTHEFFTAILCGV